jgi:sugar lactone lactonase YvrE
VTIGPARAMAVRARLGSALGREGLKRSRGRGRPLAALAGAALLLALLGGFVEGAGSAPGPASRERFDLRVFTRVGEPGQPEPVAIGGDGRVYVGTNQQGKGDASAPSRIFAYSRTGTLLRQYVIKGQDLSEDHGIQGIAVDGAGRLFALDRAADPRVVAIDPKSGRQRTYARFRDVPSCSAAGQNGDCSATMGDSPSGPDYAVFGPGGALYVTDIDQALIWRVPRGGGRASVWLTDPRFESVFGPNGIQLVDGGRRLLLAVTATFPSPSDTPTSGALFEIPLRGEKRRPGHAEELWRSRPVDGPDGFAVGRSGTVYLALAGTNQIVVISSSGEEIARLPASPAENAAMEVPLDGPASAAFLGKRVLITNQSTAGNPSSWAVYDLYAGERGLPLFRPRIRPSA